MWPEPLPQSLKHPLTRKIPSAGRLAKSSALLRTIPDAILSSANWLRRAYMRSSSGAAIPRSARSVSIFRAPASWSHRPSAIPALARHDRRVTGSKGPELILEMLANVNLAADLDLVAKYGRIIVIGNRGEITVNPRVAMMEELDIRSIALWNATEARMKPVMRDILAGVAEGSLRPVVGREMRLSEAAAAHVAVLERGVGRKIVLIPK